MVEVKQMAGVTHSDKLCSLILQNRCIDPYSQVANDWQLLVLERIRFAGVSKRLPTLPEIARNPSRDVKRLTKSPFLGALGTYKEPRLSS